MFTKPLFLGPFNRYSSRRNETPPRASWLGPRVSFLSSDESRATSDHFAVTARIRLCPLIFCTGIFELITGMFNALLRTLCGAPENRQVVR
jgi:hypothetical protein